MGALGLAIAIVLGAAAHSPPVTLSVWGVHATDEGRSQPMYAIGLEPLRKVLKDLPFDTYEKTSFTRDRVSGAGEKRFAIDDRYTLYLRLEEREADQRVRMHVRIVQRAEKTGDPPVTALDTVIRMAQRGYLKFGGMKSGDATLVIVLKTE